MKLIRDLLVLASGILSALYLLNMGFGLVEIIPDNVPIFWESRRGDGYGAFDQLLSLLWRGHRQSSAT